MNIQWNPICCVLDAMNYVTGTHQEAIDSGVEQGGFVILCHPNWIRKEYWLWKDIDNIRGFTGFGDIQSFDLQVRGFRIGCRYMGLVSYQREGLPGDSETMIFTAGRI